MSSEKLIPPHGGYRGLKAYQNAVIIHDATVRFCEQFVSSRSRTVDQMVQAARSGKQNIAEGSVASGTSKKTELKLISVARASQEELLVDFEDFLRQNNLARWDKESAKSEYVRRLAYQPDRSYETYRRLIEDKSPETAANTMICLINQTNYLLDRLMSHLEQEFINEGGFTERLYRMRKEHRKDSE